MKKIISSMLAISMLVATAAVMPATAEDAAWKEFYVSTDGNDANPGTKEAPFATVHAAQEAVKKVNRDMQGDIICTSDGSSVSFSVSRNWNANVFQELG